MKVQAKIAVSITKILIAIGFAICVAIITTASSKDVTKYLVDQYVGIIAIIFYYDVYCIEVDQNTAESFYLQMNYKTKILMLRVLVCEIISVAISIMSMLLLCVKTTDAIAFSWTEMFVEGLFAYAGTAFFFGTIALTVANFFYNKWIGAIVSALLMGVCTSTKAVGIPLILNLFSFGCLTTEGFYEDWWISKLIYIAVAIILIATNISMIKRPPQL